VLGSGSTLGLQLFIERNQCLAASANQQQKFPQWLQTMDAGRAGVLPQYRAWTPVFLI
jgi:hypothetical protein